MTRLKKPISITKQFIQMHIECDLSLHLRNENKLAKDDLDGNKPKLSQMHKSSAAMNVDKEKGLSFF